MNDNSWSSSSGNGVGTFSNLQRDQVHRGKDAFGNKDTYGNKDTFGNKDVYGNKNPWKNDNPYQTNDVYGTDERIQPKYKRFSDLKILNENMMHMSNNTLPEESRIEILSQGEKGEIKNVLSYRIFKIALVPALSSLAFGALIVLTNSTLLTLFGLFVYMGILVRTFFYPAKLYYENIKYKTTKPARAFFEEMDYWYKISVVNVYVYVVLVSIGLFVFSFYEDDLVKYLCDALNIDMTVKNPSVMTFKDKFLQGIGFSISLKLLAMFNIVMLAYYSHFANKEKAKAEESLRERMRSIRNESLSRVGQVQEDKNDF